MEMNYPIRVAQIIGEAPNGGVESVIRNYYEHIDRSKYQFDFYVNNTSNIIRKDKIEEMGGRIFIVPPYKKNIVAFEKFLYKKFKEEKYLIVHSNMNTLSYFVLRAAKKAGVPIRIAHSHSTSNPHEFVRNSIKNILRLKSKKYATNYVACSEVAGRWLFGDKAFDQGKVTIFNNGIDVEKFKFDNKERQQLRERYHISNSTIVLGHIGRLVVQKNQRFLISVFAEYQKSNSDSILVILGEGPLEDELKAEVSRLNISDKVIFAGTHKHPEHFYSMFDVFLLPSLYEGFGMVLIEAQASGLPCLMSESIPMDAKVLDTCNKLSIDSEKEWVDELKKVKNTFLDSRINAYASFIGKKYDISYDAKELERYYDIAISNKDA